MTHAQAERETVRRLKEQLSRRRRFSGGDVWVPGADTKELPDGAVRLLALELGDISRRPAA